MGIESAVANVLSDGHRTADIALAGENVIGTMAMANEVIKALTP